jgi:hypothetical protein
VSPDVFKEAFSRNDDGAIAVTTISEFSQKATGHMTVARGSIVPRLSTIEAALRSSFKLRPDRGEVWVSERRRRLAEASLNQIMDEVCRDECSLRYTVEEKIANPSAGHIPLADSAPAPDEAEGAIMDAINAVRSAEGWSRLNPSALSVTVPEWSTKFEYTVRSMVTAEESRSPEQVAAKLAETAESQELLDLLQKTQAESGGAWYPITGVVTAVASDSISDDDTTEGIGAPAVSTELDFSPLAVFCGVAAAGVLLIGLLLVTLKQRPCRHRNPNTGDEILPTIIAAGATSGLPPPLMPPSRSGADYDAERFFAGGGNGGEFVSLINDQLDQLGDADGGASDFFGTCSVQIDMTLASTPAPAAPLLPIRTPSPPQPTVMVPSVTPAYPPPAVPALSAAPAYMPAQHQEMSLPPPPYVDAGRQRIDL